MEPAELAEHLDRLRRGLAEIGTRVEHQLLELDAALDRRRDPPAQEFSTSSATRPSSDGSISFCFGAARVCISTSAAPVSAHTSASAGSRSPLTSLTIAAPDSIAAAGHLRLVGVDRHERAELTGDPLDYRDHRAVSSAGPTAGRLVTPDSPPIRSGPRRRRAARSRTRPAPGWSASRRLRERVGAGIDDSHQPWPAAQRERPARGAQRSRRRRHSEPIPSACSPTPSASASS